VLTLADGTAEMGCWKAVAATRVVAATVKVKVLILAIELDECKSM